jgi:hypothetical protein
MATESATTGTKRITPPTNINSPAKMVIHRDMHALGHKLRFIREYEKFQKIIPKLTVTTFASHVDFSLAPSVATKIWREREHIIQHIENTPGRMTLTKMYPRKLEPVERALFYAIQEERALGM